MIKISLEKNKINPNIKIFFPSERNKLLSLIKNETEKYGKSITPYVVNIHKNSGWDFLLNKNKKSYNQLEPMEQFLCSSKYILIK
jgi:hypothetical protein